MLLYYLDQGLNARILEEKKVGVEVPRNEQDGSLIYKECNSYLIEVSDVKTTRERFIGREQGK